MSISLHNPQNTKENEKYAKDLQKISKDYICLQSDIEIEGLLQCLPMYWSIKATSYRSSSFMGKLRTWAFLGPIETFYLYSNQA